MRDVGTTQCQMCGRRGPKSSTYCARCGAALHGVARGLGTIPAIAAGGFVVASTVLLQIVLLRAIDSCGHFVPLLSGYLTIIEHLVEGGDLLIASAAGAICGAKIENQRPLTRSGCGACVGMLLFVSRLLGGTVELGLYGAVITFFGVALTVLGAALGPTLVRHFSRLAPFSWASRLCKDNPSLWCFATVVMGLQLAVLMLPWLFVWILLGSAAVRLARALAMGGRARGEEQALDQVSS